MKLGPWKCLYSVRTTQDKMQTQDLTVIRNFFSEDEWSAIESALNDYADYGDEESDLAENIQSKIYKLFKDWSTLTVHS